MSVENFENKEDKNKQNEKELETLDLDSEQVEDLGRIFKKKILDNKGEYSESLIIDDHGFVNWENPDGSLTSLFSQMAQKPENIYLLAKKIQERFPELEFNFEKDEYGKKLDYTIKEKK